MRKNALGATPASWIGRTCTYTLRPPALRSASVTKKITNGPKRSHSTWSSAKPDIAKRRADTRLRQMSGTCTSGVPVRFPPRTATKTKGELQLPLNEPFRHSPDFHSIYRTSGTGTARLMYLSGVHLLSPPLTLMPRLGLISAITEIQQE